MSYLQAFVIALVQGVTELFPISSLGHAVLVPAWIGGSWHTLVTLAGSAGAHIHGQIALGVVVAGLAAYFSVRFLMRYSKPEPSPPSLSMASSSGRSASSISTERKSTLGGSGACTLPKWCTFGPLWVRSRGHWRLAVTVCCLVAGHQVSELTTLVGVYITPSETFIQDPAGVGRRRPVLVGSATASADEVPQGPDEYAQKATIPVVPTIHPHQCIPPPEYHIIGGHLLRTFERFAWLHSPWSARRSLPTRAFGQFRRWVD
jgi:hypothetical protein